MIVSRRKVYSILVLLATSLAFTLVLFWWRNFQLLVQEVGGGGLLLQEVEVPVGLPVAHRDDELHLFSQQGKGSQQSRMEEVSRRWEPVTNRRWCRPDDDDSSKTKKNKPGLIYVKVPKAASSTFAGINIRIARNVGQRTVDSLRVGVFHRLPSFFGKRSPVVCSHTYHHGRKQFLERETPNRTLVWTFLRDPARRAMSEFYHFEASRKGTLPTNGRLKRFLEKKKSYQFNYIADDLAPKVQVVSPHQVLTTPQKKKDPFEAIRQQVMTAYDFIGLVERKDESLAVLTLLWDLKPHDLIVLKAKQSGGYDDGRFNATCTKIRTPSGNGSDYIRDYLTTEFPRDNQDYALYAVVSRSLDKTIHFLGQDRVQEQVKRLRALQDLAEQECQALAVYPCAANGTRQLEAAAKNCYWSDCGCGYRCVDRVIGGG
jgi:hypothetical protein